MKREILHQCGSEVLIVLDMFMVRVYFVILLLFFFTLLICGPRRDNNAVTIDMHGKHYILGYCAILCSSLSCVVYNVDRIYISGNHQNQN